MNLTVKIIAGFLNHLAAGVHMFSFSPGLGIAVGAYGLIVMRWTYVINKFHNDVLADDTSYQFKEHPVFKGILLGRAILLGTIAPFIAFFQPSLLNQFFDGIKLPWKKADLC